MTPDFFGLTPVLPLENSKYIHWLTLFVPRAHTVPREQWGDSQEHECMVHLLSLLFNTTFTLLFSVLPRSAQWTIIYADGRSPAPLGSLFDFTFVKCVTQPGVLRML